MKKLLFLLILGFFSFLIVWCDTQNSSNWDISQNYWSSKKDWKDNWKTFKLWFSEKTYSSYYGYL